MRYSQATTTTVSKPKDVPVPSSSSEVWYSRAPTANFDRNFDDSDEDGHETLLKDSCLVKVCNVPVDVDEVRKWVVLLERYINLRIQIC